MTPDGSSLDWLSLLSCRSLRHRHLTSLLAGCLVHRTVGKWRSQQQRSVRRFLSTHEFVLKETWDHWVMMPCSARAWTGASQSLVVWTEGSPLVGEAGVADPYHHLLVIFCCLSPLYPITKFCFCYSDKQQNRFRSALFDKISQFIHFIGQNITIYLHFKRLCSNTQWGKCILPSQSLVAPTERPSSKAPHD